VWCEAQLGAEWLFFAALVGSVVYYVGSLDLDRDRSSLFLSRGRLDFEIGMPFTLLHNMVGELVSLG